MVAKEKVTKAPVKTEGTGLKNISTKRGQINIGMPERVASGTLGAMFAYLGFNQKNNYRLLLVAAGVPLIYRSVTGTSLFYQLLGTSTAGLQKPGASVDASRAIKVEKSVTINKDAETLFRFWRNFENLPKFMKHLESVQTIDTKRSHWVAKAPANQKVEWDAEIINEKENELIAWRSLAADVNNAGSVRFRPSPTGGTEVKIELEYEPPAGKLGAIAAKIMGEEPEFQVADDLHHFKELMETGEIPTIEGQPSGLRL